MRPPRHALLHIGMEKTGSTTLQAFMADNRDVLRARGFWYPASPGEQNHLKLNAYALDDEELDDTRTRFGLTTPDDVAQFRKQFGEQLHDEVLGLDDCHTFVFSNEHLSARLTQADELERLLELFHRLFAEVSVLIYLREQGSNAMSSYSTNIRGGSTRLPDIGQINWKKHNYYERVMRWVDAVGRSNVDVRLFDPREWVGGDLFLDFVDAIDLQWNNDFMRPERKNQGLDAVSLEFLRKFNEVAPEIIPDGNIKRVRDRMVGTLLQGQQGPRLAFPPDAIQRLRSAVAESNRKLAREFFNREILFPHDEPSRPSKMETEWSELENEDIMRLWARIADAWIGPDQNDGQR